jgi:hypothetical protein
MGNISLGTLAISMSLWAVDLGAGQYRAGLASAAAPPSASREAACPAGAQAPLDDSDLELVVCGKRLR